MTEIIEVRAAMVAQGTSLTRWCKEHGIHRQNAAAALRGKWRGPKAREMRLLLLRAAGVNPATNDEVEKT